MPITETIKKGQIKRKVSSSEVEVLKPQTDADIVLYEGTINGTAVHNVDDAIDQLILGTGVNDVKIQVDSGTATTIVNNHIATIPVTSSYSGTSETIVNGKAIKAAIDGLDVSEFKLTETNTSTNVVTLHGIKETDGKIAVGTTSSNDVTFYNKTGTDNAISTAINALDTSTNVAPAVVSGSGNTQKITFKDINETNGIIAAGSNITNAVTYTDSAIDTLLGTKLDKLTTSGNKVYAHQGTTQTEYGVDSGTSPNYIVQRDSNGQVIVPLTPTDNSHAASKKYVDDKITQGVEYLGIVDDTTELYALDSSAGEGDWVRVGTQFTYSSETCHVGDILICSAPKGSSTHATWDVIHTEVDTDTNTTYQAIVGASGTGYAGAIKLQSKEIGGSFADQDTIKFINGSSGKISITPDTTNKTLTFEHAAGNAASQASGFYKFSTDSTSHISGVTAVAKADLTGLGVADDSLVAHLAGPETFSGKKTFSNGLNISGSGATAQFSVTNDSDDGELRITGVSYLYGPTIAQFGVLEINSIVPNDDDIIYLGNSESSATTLTSAPFSDASNNNNLRYATNWNGTVSTYGVKFPDTHSYLADRTLATLSDIPSVSDFVTKSTEQTITGTKTIAGSMYFKDGTSISGFTNIEIKGSDSNAYIRITGGDTDSQYFKIGALVRSNPGGTYTLTLPEKTGTLAVLDDIPNSIISGKKANGSTDITSTISGRTFTLGDSGITAGTYSAIQINAKGIAVAGGQILDVIAHGGTPNVVNGGWYFEELATA